MASFIENNIYPTILNFDEAGAERIFGGDNKEALFLIISDS
jgi:hypothetical protein